MMIGVLFTLQVLSFLAANVEAGLSVTQEINRPALQQALNLNRAKWVASGTTSYVLRQEIVCFCPGLNRGPFEITVVDGTITKVTNDDGTAAPGLPNGSLQTVEDTFDNVQRFINQESTGTLEVSYDPALGYVRSYQVGDRVPVGVAVETTGANFEIVRIISRRAQALPPLPIQFPFLGGIPLSVPIPILPQVPGAGGVVLPPVNVNLNGQPGIGGIIGLTG